MPSYEIIEKHATYLKFKVEASSQEEAFDKVRELAWDDADEETTEFENTWSIDDTGAEVLND